MKKVSDLKENIDPEKIKDPLPNAKIHNAGKKLQLIGTDTGRNSEGRRIIKNNSKS